MKHTLSVLLRNKPGALSRVTGLFSGRGFNIESLCVAETFDPQVSCLTVVTSGASCTVTLTVQRVSAGQSGSPVPIFWSWDGVLPVRLRAGGHPGQAPRPGRPGRERAHRAAVASPAQRPRDFRHWRGPAVAMAGRCSRPTVMVARRDGLTGPTPDFVPCAA